MRLFLAVRLSPEICRTLLAAQEALRRQGARGSFSRPENFHVTLAFLGETENERGARNAMDAACNGGAFPLELSGVGNFGQLRWVGVRSGGRLEELALRLQDALRAQGFALEERPFRPHITLVRRLSVPCPPLSDLPHTAMTVDAVSLMRSERIRGVLTYTELWRKKL